MANDGAQQDSFGRRIWNALFVPVSWLVKWFLEHTWALYGASILAMAGGLLTLDRFDLISINDPQIRECHQRAKKMGLQYILESVLEIVHIDQNPANRFVRSRIVYNLHTLQDTPNFSEEYDSKDGTVSAWHGPRKEKYSASNNPKRLAYDVELNAKKNELVSLITGANYTYDLPVKSQACIEGVPMNEMSEGCYSYDDRMKSPDCICSLSIIVESDNLFVGAAETVPVVRSNGGTIDYNEGLGEGGEIRMDRGSNQQSVAARWTNVFPGQSVMLHFSWKPAAVGQPLKTSDSLRHDAIRQLAFVHFFDSSRKWLAETYWR